MFRVIIRVISSSCGILIAVLMTPRILSIHSKQRENLGNPEDSDNSQNSEKSQNSENSVRVIACVVAIATGFAVNVVSVVLPLM